MRASSSPQPAVKLAFELLVLTAARSAEVRLATRDEMDVAGRVWTVPARRMKAKREQRLREPRPGHQRVDGRAGQGGRRHDVAQGQESGHAGAGARVLRGGVWVRRHPMRSSMRWAVVICSRTDRIGAYQNHVTVYK